MFKIGEFSKLTQVSIRMLRYYDEVGLLKPSRVDTFTSYRLYTAEQIPDLNKIVFLRDMGCTVSEITAALAGWNAGDDSSLKNLLEAKRLEAECALQAEQERLSRIALAQKDLLQETITINYNVTLKAIPGYQVLSLRRVVPDFFAEGLLWKEMSAFVQGNNIPVSPDTFAIYHDKDYREKDVDIEVCAPVSVMGESADGFTYRHTEPVPLMACTMVYGPFENIAGAYRSFAGWLGEHSYYEMTGESRQIVHRGPWNEESSESYLTEIQIPLKRKTDNQNI